MVSRADYRLLRAFLLAKLKVDIASVTAGADIARKAFRRYGRGRHATNLNFEDCFAYAPAKDRSAPLLFKGDDFGRRLTASTGPRATGHKDQRPASGRAAEH
jgi:uncharacterized protein with PIN domain